MISLLVRGLAGVLITASAAMTSQTGELPMPAMLASVAVAEAPIEKNPFEGYEDLERICACESNLKHFQVDGKTVLRGRSNPNDIGICQINEFYHKKRIGELGIDIYTKEGNIEFAKHLYDREGSDPWIWSKACWSR